jgi:tetratricopeptide (TPR) repeat protein
MTSTAPWVALIKPAPYYAHAQFSPAADIIALPEPMDVDSVSKAGWHYARGVAFAELGELDKAKAEAQRIEALLAQEDIAAFEAAFVPASSILTISIRTVEARIAAKSGDLKKAISLMEAAADMQDRLPYSEPALWYYPARQTLAALLLTDGQLERAEKMFQRTLLETPNNAFALYGLWQTYKAQGDTRSVKYAKALYKKAWMGNRKEHPAPGRI